MKKMISCLVLLAASFSSYAQEFEKVELGVESSRRLGDKAAFMLVLETKWDASRAKFVRNTKYYKVKSKLLLGDETVSDRDLYDDQTIDTLVPYVDIQIIPVKSVHELVEDGYQEEIETGNWAVGYHRDVKVGVDTMLSLAFFTQQNTITKKLNSRINAVVNVSFSLLTLNYAKGTNGLDEVFGRAFSGEASLGYDFKLSGSEDDMNGYKVRILGGVRTTELAGIGLESFVRMEYTNNGNAGIYVEYSNQSTDSRYKFINAKAYFDRVLKFGFVQRM